MPHWAVAVVSPRATIARAVVDAISVGYSSARQVGRLTNEPSNLVSRAMRELCARGVLIRFTAPRGLSRGGYRYMLAPWSTAQLAQLAGWQWEGKS